MSSLYDSDFVRWAETQRNLLSKQKFDHLDLENLIEEIDSLARREHRSLKSHLYIVLVHLLKLTYTLGSRDPKGNWVNSIDAARNQIDRLIEDSPSLGHAVAVYVPREYKRATRQAHRELQRYNDEHEPFPETCPWTPEQVIDPDFFPPSDQL